MAIKLFKIEAWKAERWNQQTLPNDGVNDVFENTEVSETINAFLTHHGLTADDLVGINFLPNTTRDTGTLDIWLTCRTPSEVSDDNPFKVQTKSLPVKDAGNRTPAPTGEHTTPAAEVKPPLDQISRIWIVKIEVNLATANEHAIGKRYGKYVDCPTGQKVSGTLDYVHEFLKAQRCEPMNWATNDPTVYEVWSKP